MTTNYRLASIVTLPTQTAPSVHKLSTEHAVVTRDQLNRENWTKKKEGIKSRSTHSLTSITHAHSEFVIHVKTLRRDLCAISFENFRTAWLLLFLIYLVPGISYESKSAWISEHFKKIIQTDHRWKS